MPYLTRIIDKFSILKEDFVGIQLDLPYLLHFILLLFFSFVLFFYFYSIGNKFRKLFFKFTDSWKEKYFINVAFGYIILCSGVTFLGMTSSLTPFLLSLYLILTTFLIIFPIRSLQSNLYEVLSVAKSVKKWFVSGRLLKIALLGFILISFLRL